MLERGTVTSRGCAQQVLAAVDQQRGAGDGRRFEQEAHRARDVVGVVERGPAASCGAPAAKAASLIAGPDSSVTPGATPHTRTCGASACASSVVAASQRGLGQRVRQVVRVRVPQLLVEQVDHAAASRCSAFRCACSACASSTRGRCWRASACPSRRSEKLGASSYSKCEALLTTASSAAHALRHRRHAARGRRPRRPGRPRKHSARAPSARSVGRAWPRPHRPSGGSAAPCRSRARPARARWRGRGGARRR